MGEIVKAHQPCAVCGSSDAVAIYDDGQSHCFSCEHHSFGDAPVGPAKASGNKELIPMDSLTIEPLRARGISSETCRKYGYFIGNIHGSFVQVANYYDDNGTVIGQKIRTIDKKFSSKGTVSDRFFGQHLFSGGKKLVVTEGEIDCLTVSQVQGNKWPVVSIPNGAKSAVKTFKAQKEWLNQFEEVIVMFDMDEPGQEAVKAVSGILKPGKLKIARLPLKDPNECLKAGKAEAIINGIWQSQPYRPDGIVNGRDLWELLEAEEANVQSFQHPWAVSLQEMTRGIRKGEMYMITAGTGTGKTTFVRQMAYHLGVTLRLKVGLMHLEENKKMTAKGLMSLHVGKRLHLENNVKDYKAAFDDVLGHDNFLFYDHFGSIDGDNLLDKMRWLAVDGCDFVVLDHISIAVSGLEGPDERRTIDRMMTQLRSLVEETGIGLIIVSHLRKAEGERSHEEGGAISLDQLRGSGTLKQIPDTILALERNQQDPEESERNKTRLRLLKCRFTGETGIAGYLQFDRGTGRLEVAESPQKTSVADVFKKEEGTDF